MKKINVNVTLIPVKNKKHIGVIIAEKCCLTLEDGKVLVKFKKATLKKIAKAV